MAVEFISSYLSELNKLSKEISPSEFDIFVKELKGAYDRESYIFVFGNGGSGSTASHFVCDMNKGASYGKAKRFKVVCLNDNIPTILAYANDVSYDDVFVEQLKNFLKKDDLVIGISGSGNSNNVLKAIRFANDHEGKTFGICGFGGGKLKDLAQNSFVVQSKDMQKVEDMHIILIHCTMQLLFKDL
ncbi:SIS domain-containing protein [bacterium]|nr:SIS domain-containing protein [bacterium]